MKKFFMLIPLLLVFFFYLANYIYDHYQPGFRKFDQEIWLQAEGEYDCIRGEMYRDISENHLKFGQSYQQVTDLLGAKPFSIKNNYFSEKLNSKVKRISYDLGVCRLVFGSDHYLVLYFSQEDVLSYFNMVE